MLTEQIAASVNQVSSNFQNAAAVTAEVNYSVQEQVATIEEISKELGEKTLKLQQSIQHFNL